MFIPKDNKNRFKSINWRTRKAESLGDSIKDWIAATQNEQAFLESLIIHRWPVVVGPVIAARTIKIYMQMGILHLEMSSAPLKHQLLLRKSLLIEKLNQEAGKEIVKDIFIQ